ncbi:hypothetical protein B0H17DRAFT_1147203 [Mycena rosella]|uniref:Uncharacterized protein n=1 Tax=Mycena rosella TaxID=1033263 RepID=A0AAD7CM65_MYCRO|nr:hypothetical protein B0H17DRAFT_1147203 [Mycena rosella]
MRTLCPTVDKDGSKLTDQSLDLSGTGALLLGCTYKVGGDTKECHYTTDGPISPDTPAGDLALCPDSLADGAPTSSIDSSVSPSSPTDTSTPPGTSSTPATSGGSGTSGTATSTDPISATGTSSAAVPPSASSPLTQNTTTTRRRVPAATIAGVVVSVSLLILVFLLLLWLRRRRRRIDDTLQQYTVQEVQTTVDQTSEKAGQTFVGESSQSALSGGSENTLPPTVALEDVGLTNETLTERIRCVEAQLDTILAVGMHAGAPPGYTA